MKALAALAGALAFLLAPQQAGSGTYSAPASVHQAIVYWFGSHWQEAETVAWCESRWNVYAHNGQYLGLFQMGSLERARYGHSWTAWGQARAASRYWRTAGWRPWACRP